MATSPGRQGWSPTPSVADPKPWFRQFWLWFLILFPLASVVGGITMLFIAMHDPDGLVVDDYYKAGLAINRTLQRQDEARRLGVEAAGRLDLATGDVAVDLKGKTDAVDRLSLRLVHATRSEHDQALDLTSIVAGRFAGHLAARLPPGAWAVSVEPPDGRWRVTGRILVDGGAAAGPLTLLLVP